MEWPSKNVSYGGILHPAKANYTPETQKFLKVLMDEAKMTIYQRKKVDYYLRNGQPFPLPTSRSSGEISSRKKLPTVVVRPGSSRRRTRETIMKSGAYEREKFIPREPRVDREKEKSRLQSKMAFGTNIEPKPPKIKPQKNETEVEINRFDQLVSEIKEREDWLRQMEELGEADKHRSLIQLQIQARVREMQKLKAHDA